jgi:hypothetical protein
MFDGKYEDGVSEIVKAEAIVANAQAQFGRLYILETPYVALAS